MAYVYAAYAVSVTIFTRNVGKLFFYTTAYAVHVTIFSRNVGKKF